MKDLGFTTQERLENIDVMVWQYVDVIFDLVRKVQRLMELKKHLTEQINSGK